MLGPGGGGQEEEDTPNHSHQVLSSCLLLSPQCPHLRSPTRAKYGPPSPVLSDLSDSGSVWNPPSPTLSNHSGGPFLSTLRLRELEEKYGLSQLGQLGLLNPDSFRRRRRRQGSATSLTDVARSDGVHHSHFNTTSVTNVDHLPHSPTNDIGKDDQQTELMQDAAIDPAPFRFKPYELAHMLDARNIETLVAFGGVDGVLRRLGTNADTGLVTEAQYVHSSQGSHKPSRADKPVLSATIDDGRRIYGENVLPTRITKTLLQLMWAALKDKVLILLSVAAIISLALGLYQDIGPSRNPNDPPVDWIEGVAIMVAIAIIVIVGSLNDWQKEHQFKVLSEQKDERSLKEAVVGDIALLEPGEVVPCDGIFISGHNVKCDESGTTEESDAIRKIPFSEIVKDYRHTDSGAHKDCFIISGSKVLEGVGKYIIVAVGNKCFNGRIIMGLRGDTGNTPLQVKLNDLTKTAAFQAVRIGGREWAIPMVVGFVSMLHASVVAVGQALKNIKFYILHARMPRLENGRRYLDTTFRWFTSGFSSKSYSSHKDWTSSGNPRPEDIVDVGGAWKDINWCMENISRAVQNGHNDERFLRLIVEQSDSLWDRFINMPYRASPFIRKSIEAYRLILFDVNEAIHSHSSISPNRMDEFNVRFKEVERDLVAIQFEHMRPPDNPSQHQSFHMFKDARNFVITGGKFIQSGPGDRYDRQLAKMMYMHYLTLGVLFG